MFIDTTPTVEHAGGDGATRAFAMTSVDGYPWKLWIGSDDWKVMSIDEREETVLSTTTGLTQDEYINVFNLLESTFLLLLTETNEFFKFNIPTETDLTLVSTYSGVEIDHLVDFSQLNAASNRIAATYSTMALTVIDHTTMTQVIPPIDNGEDYRVMESDQDYMRDYLYTMDDQATLY
jgi:hypothetical protein